MLLRFVALLSLVAGAAACAETENDVVFSGAAPVAPRAAPAPGLTTGCSDADAPPGRFRGRVFPIPLETRLMPRFDELPPAGTICLDQLAISERRGYPGFPGLRNRTEWFGVDLRGAFTVEQPGLFYFRLTSDDGSKLYIDDTLVIDNDGYHVVRTREAGARLTAGQHVMVVPYWQGPGPLALILEVARAGAPYEIFHIDRPLVGAE